MNMNTVIKRELEATDTTKPSPSSKRRREAPPIDLNAALAIAAQVLKRESQRYSNEEKVSYPSACYSSEPMHRIRRHSFIGREKVRLLSEGKVLLDYDFGDDGVTLKWEYCNTAAAGMSHTSDFIQGSSSFQSSRSMPRRLPDGNSSSDRKPDLSNFPCVDDGLSLRSAIPGLSVYNRLGVPTGTLEDPIDITEDYEQAHIGPLELQCAGDNDEDTSSSGKNTNCFPSSRAITSGGHGSLTYSRLLDIFDSESDSSDGIEGRAEERTSTASSFNAGVLTLLTTPKTKTDSVPPIAVLEPMHDVNGWETSHSSDLDGNEDSVDETLSVGVQESLALDDDDHIEDLDDQTNAQSTVDVSSNNMTARHIPNPNDNDSSDIDESESDPSDSEEDDPPQFGRLRRLDASTKFARYSKGIQLPRVSNGRPRRLLLSPTPNEPMMTVSMRGDVQFISTATKFRIADKSLPAENESYRVEDACRIGTHAILAHGVIGDNSNEIAVVSAGANRRARPCRTFLSKRAHGADGNQGISCIAPFLSECGTHAALEFITGGNDKSVVLWRVRQSQTAGTSPKASLRTTTTLLTRSTRLNSRAIALARHPQANVVHATAGRRLWSIEIETGKANNIRFSNDILHLHMPLKDDPSLLLAEVDHMYAQMQLLDLRSPMRARPILEFGRAIPDKSPSVDSNTLGLSNSRKRRGDTTSQQYVRGYHDGKVFLWDYRALRDEEASNGVVIGDCKVPVWHTVFGKRKGEVWSFGQEQRGGRGGIVNYFEV